MKNLVKTTTENPSLFLTDYASYNEGKQFEFGHWVDLTDFSDADEFLEYVSNHFAEADEKSPLPFGAKREEAMFTDFENLPNELYSESLSTDDIEKIYKYIALDWENLSDDEKLSHWNEYCLENSIESELYSFDDDFFTTFFEGKPMEAARAASFGNLNWSDDYIYFNGYGNLKSTNDPTSVIDEKELLNWLIENL